MKKSVVGIVELYSPNGLVGDLVKFARFDVHAVIHDVSVSTRLVDYDTQAFGLLKYVGHETLLKIFEIRFGPQINDDA